MVFFCLKWVRRSTLIGEQNAEGSGQYRQQGSCGRFDWRAVVVTDGHNDAKHFLRKRARVHKDVSEDNRCFCGHKGHILKTVLRTCQKNGLCRQGATCLPKSRSEKEDTEDDKYSKYVEEYVLDSLIKKYSDYIRYPIIMNCEKKVPKPKAEGDENAKQEYDTVEEDKTMTDSTLEHDLFNLIDSMYDDKED